MNFSKNYVNQFVRWFFTLIFDMKVVTRVCLIILLLTIFSLKSFASSPANTNISETADFTPAIYLWLALSILMSRGLSIVKKIGLPVVTSEILAGIVLGHLYLFGITTFIGMNHNEIIQFLSEIGAMILMFEIGLETQIKDISNKLVSGMKIALFGTVLTFSGGYYLSEFFYPGMTTDSRILLGVITAATATGISAKVFKDLKLLATREVKLVLTASLIDEVLSILCFAIVSGVLIAGNVEIETLITITAKITVFFLLSITLGTRLTPLLTRLSVKIHAGISMKIGLLFFICTLYTWLASVLGVAPVIGAFIAGLVIDPEHFKNFSQAKFLRELKLIANRTSDENAKAQILKTVHGQETRSLDELIKPLSNIFVPIFFTYIGLIFKISDLTKPRVVLFAISLLVISLIGRIISGYSEKEKLNKLLVGLGMTPIGEAGLIFAVTGHQLGIINNDIMSAIVLAVVLITIITPTLIKISLKSGHLS